MTVADFAYGKPGGIALKAAGIDGVIRYACGGRDDINITAGEVADYLAHGLDIGITCEHQADFMTYGRETGRQRAQQALDITRRAGLRDGVILFAVDFDATLGGPPASSLALTNMHKIADTLEGCADVVGWDGAGIYGGYYVLDWLLQNTPLEHVWQTVAWSTAIVNGQRRVLRHPSAPLIQDGFQHFINGVEVDTNTVYRPWPARTSSFSDDDLELTVAQFDDLMKRIDFWGGAVTKRFDTVDARGEQLAEAISVLYGRQKPDGSGPVDRTHTGIGDVARKVDALTVLVKAVGDHLGDVPGNAVGVDLSPFLAELQALDTRIQNLTLRAVS